MSISNPIHQSKNVKTIKRITMINYIKIGVFAFAILATVSGCKKSKSASSEQVKLAPGKAILVFPEINKVCLEGIIISTTQSSIAFNWDNAANADSYILNLKNLSTGATATYPATTSELNVSILRGTPYSWFVTSKSSASPTTTQSDVWKFYNAGVRTESYAPYPAEMVSPLMGQTLTPVAGKVTLSWKGNDADNDITVYDIYLGTTTTPTVVKSNLTTTISTDITVVANTLYYWKVITKDAKGNSSDSGLYQFKTN